MPLNPETSPVNELLLRAARAITDLRKLGVALTKAGHPGHAIRLQGYAAVVKSLENELVEAQLKMAGAASEHLASRRLPEPQVLDAVSVYGRRPTPSSRRSTL